MQLASDVPKPQSGAILEKAQCSRESVKKTNVDDDLRVGQNDGLAVEIGQTDGLIVICIENCFWVVRTDYQRGRPK